MDKTEERARHFAEHAAISADERRWRAETSRLPGRRGEAYMDRPGGGRLWIRNCLACGSTISRRVP
jgi:hypothetical protein